MLAVRGVRRRPPTHLPPRTLTSCRRAGAGGRPGPADQVEGLRPETHGQEIADSKQDLVPVERLGQDVAGAQNQRPALAPWRGVSGQHQDGQVPGVRRSRQTRSGRNDSKSSGYSLPPSLRGKRRRGAARTRRCFPLPERSPPRSGLPAPRPPACRRRGRARSTAPSAFHCRSPGRTSRKSARGAPASVRLDRQLAEAEPEPARPHPRLSIAVRLAELLENPLVELRPPCASTASLQK